MLATPHSHLMDLNNILTMTDASTIFRGSNTNGLSKGYTVDWLIQVDIESVITCPDVKKWTSKRVAKCMKNIIFISSVVGGF